MTHEPPIHLPTISRHCLACLKALDRETWLDAHDVAQRAKVDGRTARKHLLDSTNLGYVKRVGGRFGGYRYRLLVSQSDLDWWQEVLG